MKTIVLFLGIFISVFASAEEYLIKVKDKEALRELNYEKVTTDVYLIKSENRSMFFNLLSTDGILHIEENQTYTINMGSKPKNQTPLWGLYGEAGIDAEEAWKVTKGSKDVVIAVIDTGVDYNHPDLKNNMWVNTGEIPNNQIDDDGNGFVDDVYGYDFAYNDGDPNDGQGHGTHCAGTIGASHNDFGVEGVMANVRLMALKFLSDFGSGSTANAIKSIDYAVANGADILSNSWGGGGYSLLLEEAIQRANDAGVLFVAASGNNGRDVDARPNYPSGYEIENVISVASHTIDDQLSSFSNYGATSVDLTAPGSNIKSTWKGGGYRTISGTSMATPHVSGVAGLLLSKDPNMSAIDIKKRILREVKRKPQYKGKMVTGGRLNACKAL